MAKQLVDQTINEVSIGKKIRAYARSASLAKDPYLSSKDPSLKLKADRLLASIEKKHGSKIAAHAKKLASIETAADDEQDSGYDYLSDKKGHFANIKTNKQRKMHYKLNPAKQRFKGVLPLADSYDQTISEIARLVVEQHLNETTKSSSMAVHAYPTDKSCTKYKVHYVGDRVKHVAVGDHISSSDLDDLSAAGHKITEVDKHGAILDKKKRKYS